MACLRARRAAVAALILVASAAHAGADESFQGKQVTIHVGSGPGGAYDTFARLLARHFARHIPGNPNLVVTNVPGASGRRMINYIYNVAPNDGTAIGTGLSTLAFDPLMGEQSQFDAEKLAWIGSSNKETAACIIWHGSPIKTIEDVRKHTTTVGSSGPSSTDSIYPNVLNSLFGMQFKVVAGYASAPEMSIAIERGELDGRCGLTWSSLQSVNADWIREKRIRIILQFALEPHPDLAGVPFVLDLAKTDEERQIVTLWAAPNQM